MSQVLQMFINLDNNSTRIKLKLSEVKRLAKSHTVIYGNVQRPEKSAEAEQHIVSQIYRNEMWSVGWLGE